LRSIKELTTDLIKKPPMLFPLVGLFHVLWLLRTVYSMSHAPMGLEWLQVVWIGAFTVFWLGICDMRKWAAFCYIAITIVDFALFFSLKQNYQKDLYTSSILFIDGIFSFFVLFYFKRFE